jgi:hypothetical protein
LDLGRVLFFIEKMSCKTEYGYCSVRDRQSELMSVIAYHPTSLPFPPPLLDHPKADARISPNTNHI